MVVDDAALVSIKLDGKDKEVRNMSLGKDCVRRGNDPFTARLMETRLRKGRNFRI